MSDAAIIALAGIFTTIGSIITTVVVGVFQERRLNQKFDRQMKLEAARAEHLAKRTESVAAELKEETRKQTEEVKTKVDENTEISRQAFHEANDVNRKIYNLTRQFLGDDPVEAITTLETIDKTTKDTQEKVTEIREAIDGDGSEQKH